jgi:hypothetical protein
VSTVRLIAAVAAAAILAIVPSRAPVGQETEGQALNDVPDSLRYTYYDSLYAHELADSHVIELLPEFVGFGEGEKLVFSVQYGIVNAGEASLEIRNIASISDTDCYRIVSNARTNDVFSVFFKVRDRFESYLDTTELYSVRYEKHVREGKFRRDDIVEFDQHAHTASQEDKLVPIAPRTQDVLSALYYVRTLPLEVGQSISVANHTDGKNYPLVINVLRRETVTVDAGTFDCFVVEPILRGPAIFTQKGRLTVWFTNDRYKIPVLMKSKVVIGSVAAVLKEYSLAKKFRQ